MADIWGWLNPMRDKLDVKELTGNEHTIRYEGHEGFKILKSDDDVQLEGIGVVYISNNYTEVMDEKVGAGKKITLNHNDRIATMEPPQLSDYVYLNKRSSEDASKLYPKEVSSKYRVSYMLGKGGFGEVYLVFERSSNKRCAMKVIKKLTKNTKYFEPEVKIMEKLKHPCCVRLEQVIIGINTHFVILEHMAGGDLASYIKDNKQLPEPTAKIIFYQLTLAMEYLHTNKIVHRDIKPENVLLASKSREMLIKVTDFGVSKILHDETALKSVVGTHFYMAPELNMMGTNQPTYTPKVDVWSMGILLYYCLTNTLPFKNPLEVMKLTNTNIASKTSLWYEIPDNAASLMKKMLKTEPDDRIDVKDILADAWLQDDDMKKKAECLMKDEIEFVGVVFVKKVAAENKRVAYVIGLNDEESWLLGNKDFIYDCSFA